MHHSPNFLLSQVSSQSNAQDKLVCIATFLICGSLLSSVIASRYQGRIRASPQGVKNIERSESDFVLPKLRVDSDLIYLSPAPLEIPNAWRMDSNCNHSCNWKAGRGTVVSISLGYVRLHEAAKVGTLPKKTDTQVRFSPRWLKRHREKLDLSAQEYAKLVGVSPLSIYGWEKGKAKPRKQHLPALAGLRGLGKREVRLKLETMK